MQLNVCYNFGKLNPRRVPIPVLPATCVDATRFLCRYQTKSIHMHLGPVLDFMEEHAKLQDTLVQAKVEPGDTDAEASADAEGGGQRYI